MKHTPEPWSVATGSHVCGAWSGMVRVESPDDFHNNGHDYPDGGSTRSYTNVVCGTTGHSETAIANVHRIVACVNACAGLDVAKVEALLDAVRAECESKYDDAISTAEHSRRQHVRIAACDALRDSIRAAKGVGNAT